MRDEVTSVVGGWARGPQRRSPGVCARAQTRVGAATSDRCAWTTRCGLEGPRTSPSPHGPARLAAKPIRILCAARLRSEHEDVRAPLLRTSVPAGVDGTRVD